MEYDLKCFEILEKRKQYENIILLNERIDKTIELQKLEVKHSKFDNIGFRETKLSDCNFSHDIFVNCYFKKCNIWNVNFTGCKFIDCKFDDAIIKHSDFIYAEFENCCIGYNDMFNNLPAEYNLREKICRNLSLESLKLGYDHDYKLYFNDMKKSKEANCFETFRFHPKDYYKNKTFSQRICAFIDYIKSKINKIVWGYGENLYQLFSTLILVVIVFSAIYKLDSVKLINSASNIEKVSFIQALYISIMNLCTTSAGYYAGNM